MQKGFGLIGILIVVGIIAGMGAFVFTSVFPDKNPFTPNAEEKSAIDMAEQMKDVMEEKSGETTSIADTANWKTYRNNEYGFEVNYPGDWSAAEKLDRIIFTHPTAPETDQPNFAAEIGIFKDINETKSFNSANGYWIQQGDIYYAVGGRGTRSAPIVEKNINRHQILMANTFRHTDFEGSSDLYKALVFDENMYIGIDVSSREEVFKQILATFKFTK